LRVASHTGPAAPETRSALDRFVALFDLGIDPSSVPPDRMRRIRILGIATAAMIAGGGGYGVRYGQLGLHDLQAAVVVTVALAMANLALLRLTLRPDLCAHVALALLTAMCSYSAYGTGGFYDTNFAWLYLVPICAAVVLDWRGAALWTGLVLLVTGLFWLLPEIGIAVESRVPPEQRSGMALFSRLSAICATGLLGAAFVKGQRRAEEELARANTDLFHETAFVQLLMHAAVSANEAGSIESAMHAAVDRICHTMGWEVGHVCVVNEDGLLASSGFVYTKDDVRFRTLLDRNVADVVWHSTQEVQWLSDGSLDFRVTVSGLWEISWWIMGYGDQAEVIEPGELRDMIRQRAERVCELYDQRGAG